MLEANSIPPLTFYFENEVEENEAFPVVFMKERENKSEQTPGPVQEQTSEGEVVELLDQFLSDGNN